MRMPPKKSKSSDMFMTPDYAIKPLLPYLKKDWHIWECACGKGDIVDFLIKNNYIVLGTDIATGVDFLKTDKIIGDCIVTNPPYSLKNQFLKKCYEAEKPFALLLPLTALESLERQSLYRKYGIQLILFNRRIQFMTPSGKPSHCWFASAWFTHGLNLPEQLNFVEIEYSKSISEFEAKQLEIEYE